MTELLFKDEVNNIVGAAMEVHRAMGCGFLEPVYQEALEIELNERKIPFYPQREMFICYKGYRLKKSYVADFLAYDRIIVEIKALIDLTSREETQLLNYLKATGLQVGLLINFGAESLQWKRKVLTREGHLKKSENSR